MTRRDHRTRRRRGSASVPALGLAAAHSAPRFPAGRAAWGRPARWAARSSAASPLPPRPPAHAQPGYYPPALQGLRGAHPGSFEAAHALRDGHAAARARRTPGKATTSWWSAQESAALRLRTSTRRATARRSRILILDNHDDFGGHAKRNEFVLDGQLQLVNGGTLDIDSPRPYSAVAKGLLRELGIDVPALSRGIEHRQYYAHRRTARRGLLRCRDLRRRSADRGLALGTDAQAAAERTAVGTRPRGPGPARGGAGATICRV